MAQTRRKFTGGADSGPEAGGPKRRLLKIGEVSNQTGIGIETLRFYERSGLLDRPARAEGGYRLYDAAVVRRLHFIRRAQVLGFSLDEIGRIIAEKRLGKSPCREVREIVRHRLHELDERMAQMRRYRKELSKALVGWDKTGEADGDICGLVESTGIEPLTKESRKLRRG
ncbi:MAG TPA: heavy metal-responsive transcriptional regulator [Blastocatellia bacterium]|nr:heavy metal-responsive transcriptional regulator [Blastocatellia bacterium]